MSAMARLLLKSGVRLLSTVIVLLENVEILFEHYRLRCQFL